MNATVNIYGTELAVTAFKGIRVLTTERLANVFGAAETQVINNYDRNATRFEEGKHLFKVEGDELRALKDSISFRGSVGKNAKSLLLWTDRGASRHAKILDTDMAWEVYGELEEAYFTNRESRRAPTMAELVLQNAQALVNFERRQEEQQAEITMVRSDLAEIKQAHSILEKMPTECEGIERTRKRMNKDYGLSVPVVDTIMRDSPYAPTIRVLVRNPHAEGVTNSGYSIKEVSAVFKRFVSECRHSAGHLHTHPYIDGRFKLIRRE